MVNGVTDAHHAWGRGEGGGQAFILTLVVRDDERREETGGVVIARLSPLALVS